jgi:dCTP deaminase
MSIKSDRWIREQAQKGMIEPFSEKQVREGVVSYGLSSYGYDLRVSDEFRIFTNVNSAIVDPKHFDERSFVEVHSESVLVPPNSFALARSVEYFRIPRDVLTICVGKSTYARCGIIVNVTPFEPEWEGFVTLEISNTTPLPARVYANEGLCQISVLSVGRSLRDQLRPTAKASIRSSRELFCRSYRGLWNRPLTSRGLCESDCSISSPCRITGLREIFAGHPDFQVVATDWAVALKESAFDLVVLVLREQAFSLAFAGQTAARASRASRFWPSVRARNRRRSSKRSTPERRAGWKTPPLPRR